MDETFCFGMDEHDDDGSLALVEMMSGVLVLRSVVEEFEIDELYHQWFGFLCYGHKTRPRLTIHRAIRTAAIAIFGHQLAKEMRHSFVTVGHVYK